MDENEFEFEGKTYVAVADELDIDSCPQCAFEVSGCDYVPNCFSGAREDGMPVYFVEKKQ